MTRRCHLPVLFPLLALLAVAGCITPSDREGARLQNVGENVVANVDTTGLNALE